MRNLLERARAKLSRGGCGGETGGSFGRLNPGGDDLLDSAPGSPVHVPRSKWRERLAVPDQQVNKITQKPKMAVNVKMRHNRCVVRNNLTALFILVVAGYPEQPKHPVDGSQAQVEVSKPVFQPDKVRIIFVSHKN